MIFWILVSAFGGGFIGFISAALAAMGGKASLLEENELLKIQNARLKIENLRLWENIKRNDSE